MFSSFLAIVSLPAFMHVNAGPACTTRKYANTQIEVNIDHKPPLILRDRNLYELHKDLGMALYKRDINQGEEYYLSDKDLDNKEWLIGGTSHGDIKTDTNIKFLTLGQDHRELNHCVLFKEVTVDVSYQTTMTVAEDFKEGGCEYNAVLMHEKTRHEAYTEAVNMVGDKLRRDLPRILDGREEGYVNKGALNATYRRLTEDVKEVVSQYREEMISMMDEFNEIVDSPDALKNLASTCQKQKIEKMKEEAAKPKNKNSGGLGDYLKDFREK